MPSLIYFIESGDILNDNFNILKTMQTVAKTTQSKLDYDKTYRGYVISQNSNGKYKIKINGHIYENVDNPSGHTISSGDVVRVTFPQNNASQCYICMASQRDGVTPTVKSVNGKTGDVVLTQDDVPNGNTYVRTHNDFTTEDKGAISKNAQDITSLQQSKQDNITGGASSITSVNLGANKALVSNASGKVATSNVTSTELSYLSGVTSNIQEQIDAKVPTSVLPSDDLPKADSGSGNAGKSEKYSRGDHVHPTDNSKLDKNGGEASNLLIIDSYTMVDQNGNKVDVSQIDGTIKFASSGSDPNVVLKYVGDPVDEYDAVNLKTLGTIADEINTTAQDALVAAQDAQSNASSALTEAQSKAPTNHASTATTYGIGNAASYGHVRLSDATGSTSAASGGTAATPAAVKAAYDLASQASSAASSAYDLANEAGQVATDAAQTAADAQSAAEAAQDAVGGKAPKAHASTQATYGKGTLTNYGHVKLSDSILSTSDTAGGTAATPYAVKLAYDLANRAETTLLGGKKIVCGWSAVKFKNTGQQNTTISFGTTFTAKPVVLIGQPFNGVICTVFNDAVTTTNFTVNVPAVGSATLSTRQMAWIAIGDV